MLTKDNSLSNFTSVFKTLPESAPALEGLDVLRRGAMARFNEVGFPSAVAEEWRHTNVSEIAKTDFKLADAGASVVLDDIQPFSFRSESACELVFVNGRFNKQLSSLRDLPTGLTISSLGEVTSASPLYAIVQKHLAKYASIDSNPFVALNTGFIQDGAVIHVAKNVAIEAPIHLMFVTTAADEPTVTHPRVLTVVETGAEAKVVETYAGLGGSRYFTNSVSEVVVGDNAKVDHCRLQHESLAAYHVSTTQSHVGRSGVFITQSASLGAKTSRNDLNVVLGGEAAEATLNGLVMIGGDQHCDNHTLLDHAKPHCPSHELYKHVLSGHATGVFRGKILVRPDAQKTDSKQTSRSLLLSDDADMNSQPALEIYADDVKCTHGSTTGPVDEEMLFYIRSRGVSAEAAKALLTYAFAADVTRRIQIEPVRRYVENFMAQQHDLPLDLRITDLGRADEQHR